MHYEPWAISESHFDLSSLNHSETVFTIGNGYFCTRGALEESCEGEERVTFLHGVFDDMPLVFTELANVPDWLEFDLEIAGERFDMRTGEILAYERRLDLGCGLLTRRVLWRSPAGKETELLFECFASLADQHLACQRIMVTAVNYHDSLAAVTGLNGETDNQGLKHWQWVSQRLGGQQAGLALSTRATAIRLGMVIDVQVSGSTACTWQAWNVRSHPSLAVTLPLVEGQTVVLEKRTALYTSRETPHPLEAAQTKINEVAQHQWESLLQASRAAWAKDWSACDIEIEGDPEAQTALRFSLYHLLIAAPRKDEWVNIGAKTLSGFGYRGHAFWDTEIFMLPFFTYTRPHLAHNLLSYRYNLLPGARRKAKGNGCQGAQYPWESAATGDEVTPTWVPNGSDPTQAIRIWTGDIEIHISADIAYAIWQYWQATGDEQFFVQRGAEIILETAKYWASRLEWKAAHGRYELTDVIGPDEYHDHVDNNAYTNYLARWNLQNAAAVAEWLQKQHAQTWAELAARLEITVEMLAAWQAKAKQIYCPYDAHSHFIEQFDGYLQRQDVNLEALEPREVSVQALLGIVGANDTQVLKQPDVIMLLYMLPDLFGPEVFAANYAYYEPRTDHTYGSSLGPSIHAIAACRMGDPATAYQHFLRAARADLVDVRGNAADGIHGASAGGLWQSVVFGFAGLSFQADGWSLHPNLPANWTRLAFNFTYRGQRCRVELPGKTV